MLEFGLVGHRFSFCHAHGSLPVGEASLNTFVQRARSGPRYRWWALFALLLGFFSTGISITILSAVLPTIARDFGVGVGTVAWVVTGPMLVTGVLMPSMGKASDLFGRKRVYLLAWALSVVFAGCASLAWNAGTLIAFKLLSAGAGAGTGPASMALILEAFRPEERVKAMGWWSFMGAGAPVLGLAIGGPLVDLVGWRWIFAIQLPLAVPGLILAWIVLKPDHPEERPSFDLAGSALLGLAAGALLFGLNRGGSGGAWLRPDVVIPLALAPILAYAFVRAEARSDDPVIHLEYFRRRNVAIPIAVQFLGHIPYMGTFFLTPFVVQSLLGYDNARTSLAILPRPLTNALVSAAAGYVAIRLGERFCAVSGTTLIVGGLVVMASITASSGPGVVVVAMVLTGAGMGLSLPGLVSSVANSVDERDFGAVSAAQNMVMTIGMVFGMQGMQTIQAARAPLAGLAASYRSAFLAGAGLAAIAVVLSFGVRSMRRATIVPPTESPEAPLLAEPVRDVRVTPPGA